MFLNYNGRILKEELDTHRLQNLFYLCLLAELFHKGFFLLVGTNRYGLLLNTEHVMTSLAIRTTIVVVVFAICCSSLGITLHKNKQEFQGLILVQASYDTAYLHGTKRSNKTPSVQKYSTVDLVLPAIFK